MRAMKPVVRAATGKVGESHAQSNNSLGIRGQVIKEKLDSNRWKGIKVEPLGPKRQTIEYKQRGCEEVMVGEVLKEVACCGRGPMGLVAAIFQGVANFLEWAVGHQLEISMPPLPLAVED